MPIRRNKRRLYGTGDKLDYVPFNIDNRPRAPDVDEAMSEAGFTRWRDLFIDWSDPAISKYPQNRRLTAFTNPNRLIRRYLPILHMIKILYDPNTGMYYAFVDADSP